MSQTTKVNFNRKRTTYKNNADIRKNKRNFNEKVLIWRLMTRLQKIKILIFHKQSIVCKNGNFVFLVFSITNAIQIALK